MGKTILITAIVSVAILAGCATKQEWRVIGRDKIVSDNYPTSYVLYIQRDKDTISFIEVTEAEYNRYKKGDVVDYDRE